MSSSKEPWVGITEIARRLNVSFAHVKTHIKDNGLPAHKEGKERQWKFRYSEVDSWASRVGFIRR